MITSNSALKSSESKLFNAGSTIKIGHFLDDIKPPEIKVPNPEISEILENVNFCINKIHFSKANQRKWTESFGEWKQIWTATDGCELFPVELWAFELIKSRIACPQTNQISSLHFEAFCHSKRENSWFSLQLFIRGSSKLTLIWNKFHQLKFQQYWYTFDETKWCNCLTFCCFSKIRRHHWNFQAFLKGNETFNWFLEVLRNYWDITEKTYFQKSNFYQF